MTLHPLSEALLAEVQSMAAGDDAWRGLDVRLLLARLERDLPAIEAAVRADATRATDAEVATLRERKRALEMALAEIREDIDQQWKKAAQDGAREFSTGLYYALRAVEQRLDVVFGPALAAQPAAPLAEDAERCTWRPAYRVDGCELPEDHEIHHPERGNAGWMVHPFAPDAPMTTTAAAWRHVDGEPCDADVDNTTWKRVPCGCTAPTPDHNGPCGFEGCTGEDAHLCYCRFAESRDSHPLHHPHQPTRCTCGHALEAVR